MPISPDDERRGHLRDYLMQCVAQHLVSLDEILGAPLVVLARLGSTLLGDIGAVSKEMGTGLGSAGAMAAAQGFMQIGAKLAEAATKGKRK